MKKIFFNILVVLLFTSCISLLGGCAHYKAYLKEQQTVTVRNYPFAYFDSLVISGRMYVEIKQGGFAVSSAAQKQFNDQINAKVQGSTLYITLPGYVPQQSVAVLINLPDLKSLKASNNAYITAPSLKVKTLNITADSHASISIQGQIGLNQVTQKSDGKIDVSWVKSKNLEINSNDNGRVTLAGRVLQLIAKLSGKAQVDTRYLRAQHADIFATRAATAHVWAAKSLKAYADEQSNIYYYRYPLRKTIVSREHGNVLYMEGIR